MHLLISDANILIDIEDGQLLDALFAWDVTLAVPDVLFEEELREHHPDLLDRGLVSLALEPAGVQRTLQLAAQHRRPSRNDLFALALAEQQRCPLLSGDRDLRAAAEAEGVEVHGTLWLVDQLVEEGHIEPEHVRIAYQRMRDTGRRLPWGAVNAQLGRLNQPPLDP